MENKKIKKNKQNPKIKCKIKKMDKFGFDLPCISNVKLDLYFVSIRLAKLNIYLLVYMFS